MENEKSQIESFRSANLQPAPPEVCDTIYRAFLDALRLSSAHRASLLARGLSAMEIDRRLYRTVPGRTRCSIISRLASKFTDEVIAGVPGFFYDSMNSRWSCSGAAGFFIPVRNSQRQIIALQIRLDNPVMPDGTPVGKYCWFSSAKHGGASPGAPIHFPGTDRDLKTMREIRVTEGVLKADVATVLGGLIGGGESRGDAIECSNGSSAVYTVGISGTHGYKAFIEFLTGDAPAVFPALQTIRIAYDADARENIGVATGLKNLAMGIMGIPE